MNAIADEIFQTLGFYISATRYLEKKSLHFTDITDLELTTKLVMFGNLGQVVTDSKEEVVKKKNKYTAKRKQRLAKPYPAIKYFSFPCLESFSFLSLFFMPAFVPAIMPALIFALMPAFISYLKSLTILSSYHMPTPVFYPRSSASLLSYHLPTLVSCLRSLAVLLFCHVFVSCYGISALLLPFLILGLPFLFRSSLFEIFKQSLSNEPWLHISSSYAKPLGLFPPLGLFSGKTNHKRIFNIAFINSCPLAGNHARKQFDLNFAKCEYLAIVKLNQLQQLKLLDLKLVCFIKAIFFVIALL